MCDHLLGCQRFVGCARHQRRWSFIISTLLGLGQAADPTRIDISTPVAEELVYCSNQWVAFIEVDPATSTWVLALSAVLHTALSTTLGPNVTLRFPPSHLTAYTSLQTWIALVADRYLVVGCLNRCLPTT